MSKKIVQLNEAVIQSEIKELAQGSEGETLNELLDADEDKLTQSARYERNEQRQVDTAAVTTAVTSTQPLKMVTLKVSKLRGVLFKTAIIEPYHRWESSMDVSGRSICSACIGHYRGSMGKQNFSGSMSRKSTK